MAQEPLVESDIQAGRDLVRALDGADLRIVGALWLYVSEIQDWKLLIVTPDIDRGARDLYLTAIKQKTSLDLSRVQFVSPSTPVFRALSNSIRGMSNMRVSHSMFNGVYVDEAFVYRLAA